MKNSWLSQNQNQSQQNDANDRYDYDGVTGGNSDLDNSDLDAVDLE